MIVKTSDSYQKEILEKYKRKKGGEMQVYLIKPTTKQIREACIYILGKKISKNDNLILDRFFQFKSEENKINEIQNFDVDKYRPVVNFLKGKAQKTSLENIELISLLIDFQPRPLREYLKTDNSISDKEVIVGPKQEMSSNDEIKNYEVRNKRLLGNKSKRGVEEKKRLWVVVISIVVVFGAIVWVTLIINNKAPDIIKPDKCMTWADSLYIQVSCNTAPFSQYGTQIVPMNEMKLKNFKKVKVNQAYQFFSDDGKPLIWYYKNKIGEIEFFTSPGLHPVNGETLRKITPYIIQTYVPIHIDKEDSFLK